MNAVDFVDLLQAIAMLGLPLAALSWLLFSWMVDAGDIDQQDSHETITAKLKQFKKADKSVRRGIGGKKKFFYDKWMWFGSGFYGLAGFWTLIVIETREVIGLFINPILDTENADFDLFSLVVDFITNQISNVVQAFVWFHYWPADSVLAWVLIAYLGYWLGVELAKHQKVPSPQQLWQRFLAARSDND